MAADNIKVAIKVRPLLKKESKLTSQWKIVDNSIQPIESQSEPFYFDHIFDENATNETIFDTMSKPIVDAALRGFNGTIFAYGQTSSGKTYTMLGDENNPGVMILAVREIFKEIEKATDREFLIRVGYIEIYNEKINDLLDKKNQDLKIHETTTGEVAVNCTDYVIRCAQDMLNYLQNGNKARRIGETIMNERSSRSHAIFRIIIESREFDKPSDDTAVQISHLNLVDLAGSERADQTGATGSRLKEGCHINKSLLSLSLVIKKLSEHESDKYINYRDSKLTRILQASLGGNALTAIICTIKSTTIEETNSTLSFAMRAKSIKNKPKINEILSDAAMMKRLAKQISQLQNELEVEKSKNSKLKISQIERKIKDAELQIVHSHALTNDTNQMRRRTWCPSTTQPQSVPNGASNINGCDDVVEFPKTAPMYMTPLITMRNYNQENVALEENFVPADEIKFDVIDERNVNDLNTPRKISKFVGKTSLTPINDIRAKYKMLETELEELQTFMTLEKDAELCEAKSKIVILEKERQELIEIRDRSYEHKVKLDRAQERCLELESRISELNEQIDSLECQQNEYHIEIEERQQKIKSLLMASKDTESLSFEFEKHKEKSKLREDELVALLRERDAKIENLEKQLRDTLQSYSSENRSPALPIEKCSIGNYDEVYLVNHNYSSAANPIDTVFNTDLAIIKNNNDIKFNGIEETSPVKKGSDSEVLQRQLDGYQNALTEKEQQLEKLYLELEKLKSKKQEIEKAHNELSDQMMEYVYENESLTKKCQAYEASLKDTEKTNEELKLKIEAIEEKLKSLSAENECNMVESQLNEFAASIVEEIIDNLPVARADDAHEEKSHGSKSPDAFQEYQSALNQLTTNKKTFLSNSNCIEKLNWELNEQICKYEGLNKELRQRLDTLNSKLKKYEVRGAELAESEEEMAVVYKLHSTDLEDTKDSNSGEHSETESSLLRQRIASLEDAKQGLEMERNNLLKSQDEIMFEMQETKKQLAELLIHKSEWEAIILQSEEEIAKFKEQVEELQKELIQARFEKEATDEKLVHVQENRSEIKVKIDSKIQEISSLQQKNAELCEALKEFEVVRNEMQQQKNEIYSIQQQLYEKNLQIDKIQAKNLVLHENHQLLTDEKENLKAQVALKSKEITEMETHLGVLREDQNKLSEVLKVAINERKEIEKEKVALIEKLENLSQSESNLQSTLMEFKATYVELENDKKATEKIQKELENQMNGYQEVNGRLKAEISAIKQEKLELEDKLQGIQGALSDVERLKDQLKQNEGKRLSEQITLEDMKAKLEQQVQELLSNKQEFCKNFEAISNENAQLKVDLEKAQEAIESLQAERNSLKMSMNQANENLIELRQERDDLLELRKQLENHFESKVNEQCDNIRAEIINVRCENIVLIDKMETLVSEKDDLQMLLNKSVLRSEALEKERSALGGKVDHLQSRNVELEKKCAQAESENTQLNAQLSDYESHISALKNQVKSLYGEIEMSKSRQQEQFEQANMKLNKLKDELEIQIQQFNRLRKENELMKQEHASNQSATANEAIVKEKDELLKQLHEMQKMHVYKIKQYQHEIQSLRSLLEDKNNKNKLGNSCKKSNAEDGDKQKIIKALLGENDELRLKNETLTAELQDSRKLSQKDRKTKRYSNHDETRSLIWCDSREISTMTDPTDKFCNCERLDKELLESKKMLLIKDCQINTLRMELKHHPLREECDRLKRLIEEEEIEKREMRKELHKLRLKISELYNTTKDCVQCIRRSKTAFINQSSQTLMPEIPSNCQKDSKLENDHAKLMERYEELKRLCRLRNSKISELENELAKKENEAVNHIGGGSANIENPKLEPVITELTLYKKKYREAKHIVGYRDKRIQELEAELSHIKSSH